MFCFWLFWVLLAMIIRCRTCTIVWDVQKLIGNSKTVSTRTTACFSCFLTSWHCKHRGLTTKSHTRKVIQGLEPLRDGVQDTSTILLRYLRCVIWKTQWIWASEHPRMVQNAISQKEPSITKLEIDTFWILLTWFVHCFSMIRTSSWTICWTFPCFFGNMVLPCLKNQVTGAPPPPMPGGCGSDGTYRPPAVGGGFGGDSRGFGSDSRGFGGDRSGSASDVVAVSKEYQGINWDNDNWPSFSPAFLFYVSWRSVGLKLLWGLLRCHQSEVATAAGRGTAHPPTATAVQEPHSRITAFMVQAWKP